MRRNLDTGLLRAFVAVAESGGMTAAARQLHLTQAAISQQIRRLEDILERPLFERGRRGPTLTTAGGMLLARAEKMLALNDEIMATMTAPAFEGEVRIGVPQDIVSPYLAPVLKSFDKAWPRVRVFIVAGVTLELLELLKQGEIDLCLTTEPAPQKGGETLLLDPLAWVGAPGGNAHRRDPLPVALGDPSCVFRQAILAALARADRDWRSVCETSNMAPLCVSVEADLGVTALLESSVPPHLALLGKDSHLPPLPDFHICLYMPQAGASEIAQEFARHIRQSLAPLRRAA
ncbi:MAG: LysR family transcriptional regulator [Geminicoccaceae bacterium]|jgi:DNA-binding transcriptional LysR family regulator|nr:LysR family transcriptional regulator [Geminicoccaceae bacterium]MCB9966112.1 LysR family transcriptional regulator [Geminicoccaceae bacterium]HRY23699.1 LysR substrate-binding domain-containing protein [Geminicoccaceae bacterium]